MQGIGGASLVSLEKPGIARNRFIHSVTGILPVARSSVVTITIASPGVVSWTGHGLSNGTPIVLSTTGALPTGLTAGTIYFIVSAAADTFQLSATFDGAAINTSGTQSGVHTAKANNGVVEWNAPGAKRIVVENVRVISGTLPVAANSDWTVRYSMDSPNDAADAILLPVTPNTSSPNTSIGQVGSFCLTPLLMGNAGGTAWAANLIMMPFTPPDVSAPIRRFGMIHNIGTGLVLQFCIRAEEEV